MAAESIYKNRVGLTEITIENFKGVSEEVKIPIRPITMLYGANSAGKSTILHALAYMREIVINNNPDADKTEIGGESIRLGGFRNMVHNSDLKKKIQISVNFTCEDDGLLYGADDESKQPESPNKSQELAGLVENCGIRVSVKYDPKTKSPVVDNLQIIVNGKPILIANRNSASGVPSIKCLVSPYLAILGLYSGKEIKEVYNERATRIVYEADELREKAAEELKNHLTESTFNSVPFELNEADSLSAYILDINEEDKIPEVPANTPFDEMNYSEIILQFPNIGGLSKKYELGEDKIIKFFDEEDGYEFIHEWLRIFSNYQGSLIMFQRALHENISLPLYKTSEREFIKDKLNLTFFKPLALDELDGDDYTLNEHSELSDLEHVIVNTFNGVIEFCRNQLHKARYIGPIRNIPSTFNSSTEKLNVSHYLDWSTGAIAWGVLTEDYNTEKKEPGDLIKRVNNYLNHKDYLDMGYHFEISHIILFDQDDVGQIDNIGECGIGLWFADEEDKGMVGNDDPKAYERYQDWIRNLPFQNKLILKQDGKDINLSPKAVGVGLTQVMPILVAASIDSIGLISIEQPELHLHPKVQCEMANVLFKSLQSGAKSYILESHSEHLILRLKNLIKEGNLHPADVSVIFVKAGNAESGSKLQRLRLDQDGDFIDEWPGGFFEEGYEEVMR